MAYREKACDTSHYEKIEGPFEIPESWEWCVLPQISEHFLGKTLNRSTDYGEDTQYLCSINIYWDGITLDNIKTAKFTKEERTKYRIQKGDILVCEGGDVGRSAIWEKDSPMYFQNALHRIRLFHNISSQYILFCIRYYKNIGLIDHLCKGVTIKHFTQNIIDSICFPIPPLAEQQRIVETIERWMTLIDAIESETKNLQQSIASAKSKILDLAIQGKLIPQDPSDEPAIELLKRINPDFKPCDNSHYPFEIPDNWSLSTFGQLNNHQSKTINPLSEPEKTFELYSVPIFETGKPEILKGIEIGSTKQLVHKGEVLVCKINPHLNRVWVVEHYNTQMNCIASSEWIVFQHPALLPKYALLYFQSPYFRERLMSNVSGVGGSLMRARPSAVDGYILPIPPINEQRRIVQAVDKLLDNLSSIGNFL